MLCNPFDLARIQNFAARDLWLIEDNRDALVLFIRWLTVRVLSIACGCIGGAACRIDRTFGHLSTQSFYPPHHLTMGEGGAVNIVRDMRLKVIVNRCVTGGDCWCPSWKDDTCNKRFGWQLGELPRVTTINTPTATGLQPQAP